MKFVIAAVCLMALATLGRADEPADTFAEVDYAAVGRVIAKEPKYVAEPRYALFILDPAGKFRAWAVFDKSKADLPYYDVVYFDTNGDGDLTAAAKRFVGKYDENLAPAGMAMTIRIGKVPVPGTKLVHTDLLFCTVNKANRTGFWFRMKWDGRQEVSGGYGPVGLDTTAYAPSAKAAPVLRPTTLGPLSFAIWEAGPVTLPIGQGTGVHLLIGSAGSGPDTLCSLSEHFLLPDKDLMIATLIAKDRDGKEIRTRNEIKQHC
jgi:hypothetical protein